MALTLKDLNKGKNIKSEEPATATATATATTTSELFPLGGEKNPLPPWGITASKELKGQIRTLTAYEAVLRAKNSDFVIKEYTNEADRLIMESAAPLKKIDSRKIHTKKSGGIFNLITYILKN